MFENHPISRNRKLSRKDEHQMWMAASVDLKVHLACHRCLSGSSMKDCYHCWPSHIRLAVHSLEAQTATIFSLPQPSKKKPTDKTWLHVPFLESPTSYPERDPIHCKGFFCVLGQLSEESCLLLNLIQQMYSLDINWKCTVDKTEK